jgi:hypothetical protein
MGTLFLGVPGIMRFVVDFAACLECRIIPSPFFWYLDK